MHYIYMTLCDAVRSFRMDPREILDALVCDGLVITCAAVAVVDFLGKRMGCTKVQPSCPGFSFENGDMEIL